MGEIFAKEKNRQGVIFHGVRDDRAGIKRTK